jgi:molecular chaperone GrpE
MTKKKEEEENGAEESAAPAEAEEKGEKDAAEPGEVQAGEADREGDGDGSGEPGDLFGAPEDIPIEEPADLESEMAELQDKLLRALAEMENVRRRASRDSADASRYAIANFAREMLGVADNLRRALDSVAGPGQEEGGEDDAGAAKGEGGDRAGEPDGRLEQLITGVEMTEREMMNVFERAGIKPIEAIGHRFDHNFHEAMFEIEDKSQPAGTVLQVMQPGFMIGGRLLRPAKVGVSKGGPKAEPDKAGPKAEPEKAGNDKPDPAATEKAAAYEKQSDSADETTGKQLDREL